MNHAALRDAAWPGSLLLAAALAGLMLAAPREALDWQPDLAWRQPWRWWTAALLHWSPMHWAMNAAGAALVALLGWRAALGPRAVAAWALAWPLTQLGLLAQPALRHYPGFSGLLHASAPIAGATLLPPRDEPRGRFIGALLCAGLLLKVLLEAPWAGATRTVAGWDFELAPAAHASGLLAGWLAWALVGREHNTHRRPDEGAP
ncbi:MAG: rhombosortase [Burkholderiaceae bacterium]